MGDYVIRGRREVDDGEAAVVETDIDAACIECARPGVVRPPVSQQRRSLVEDTAVREWIKRDAADTPARSDLGRGQEVRRREAATTPRDATQEL